MANEAVTKLEGPYKIKYYTVGDGTAIAKGTLLVVDGSAARTATLHSAAAQIPVGFAVSQKEANDGQTEMGVQKTGDAEVVVGATVDEGDLLVPDSTANRLVALPSDSFSVYNIKRICAIALQAATVGLKARVTLHVL